MAKAAATVAAVAAVGQQQSQFLCCHASHPFSPRSSALRSPCCLVQVGPDDPRLEQIYEKLDKMDPTTFDKRAGELLFGLGFSQTMMHRQTKV